MLGYIVARWGRAVTSPIQRAKFQTEFEEPTPPPISASSSSTLFDDLDTPRSTHVLVGIVQNSAFKFLLYLRSLTCSTIRFEGTSRQGLRIVYHRTAFPLCGGRVNARIVISKMAERSPRDLGACVRLPRTYQQFLHECRLRFLVLHRAAFV